MPDRTLTVKIVGDESDLLRSFRRSSKATQKFSVGIGTILKSAVVFAGVEAGMRGLTSAVRSGITEFSEQQKVLAQTNAVIKSTGGVARVTAKDVDRLAGSISNISGIDDEDIASAENLLLTFKQVRNELGEGNRVFDRATQAATDLSVAGFGSITSTAKQLGKALNDPIKGMTALGRAGVTFTAAQKKQIKTLVATGHLLEAQKLILREVESQVGGSAKALGQTLPGQLNRLRESLRNTAGDLVSRLAPAFETALGATNEFIDQLGAARGVRAKINVTFVGLQNVGRTLLQTLSKFLRRVDYKVLGKQISQGMGEAVEHLAALLRNTDFSKVGGAIINGVIAFLKGVDYVALFRGIILLWLSVLKAQATLLLGAGRALAAALLSGLRQGLALLGNQLGKLLRNAFSGLKEIATRAVLAILEPFTHLPSFLGSEFRDAKDALEKGLKDLSKVDSPVPTKVKGVEGNRSTLPRVAQPTPRPDRATPPREIHDRPININSVTVVADNPDSFLRDLQKKAGRQPTTSRGRHPGRGLGLA